VDKPRGKVRALLWQYLEECPICRRKQSTKNKKCKCGENLDKFKKQKKVRYWIDYPVPDRQWWWDSNRSSEIRHSS